MVPPTVTIAEPAPGTVVGTASVGVSASVADANPTTVTSVPAGIVASVPQGGGTVSGTVPLALEGANVISVTARDALGNVGGTSVEVIRDTTAPVVSVASPAQGTIVGESPVIVTVAVQDRTATRLFVGDEEREIPAGGASVAVQVPVLAGSNEIVVRALDAAGHETRIVRTVVLDLAAPIVRIDEPADGARFGPGGSPVAVRAHVEALTATTVDSTPAGFAESLLAGGGDVVGALDLAEGEHPIIVRATDAFGRTGSASVTVVYDTTAPSIAFTGPLAGGVLSGTVELQLAAEDPAPSSGVARIDVLLDGAPLQTFTAAPWYALFDTSALTDGPHALSATATDGLGNASEPVSIDVVVDNTPPVVTIVRPVAGGVIGGTTPFEVQATDATAGVVVLSMQVAGEAPMDDASATLESPVPATTVTGGEDTTRWPDGPLTFSATARDAAGNVATVSVAAEVDNTGPTRSLIAPRDGDVVKGIVSIQAAAEDLHLASIRILVDGVEIGSSASSPLAVSFDTRTRIDGPMTIEVRTEDVAGNAGAVIASVTVDNLTAQLLPTTVRLEGPGNRFVTARLNGPNLALLVPSADHTAELRIPGGNAVPSIPGLRWDIANTQAGPLFLAIPFERTDVIASIRAGVASGAIPRRWVTRFTATLVVDGLEQGVVSITAIGVR